MSTHPRKKAAVSAAVACLPGRQWCRGALLSIGIKSIPREAVTLFLNPFNAKKIMYAHAVRTELSVPRWFPSMARRCPPIGIE
jgi:hypothetical protein